MFEKLYSRYVALLTNHAFKVLKDADLAKDLVQEVFVALYLQREKLPAELNIGGYLTVMIKNKSLNLLRDLKVKEKHHQQIMQSSIAINTEQDDLYHQLDESIQSLPGKCKEVLSLRIYERKSYREISMKLGISTKTVEKHVSKALQLLKSEKNGLDHA